VSSQTRVSYPIYNLLATEVEGFDSLAELALDIRWSWNHAIDEVWRQLDPNLWELTHNPWGVLQAVSRDQIERVSADPVFRKSVDDLVQAKRRAAEAPAWFQKTYAQSPLTCVAYFSMEYMLTEALPIYSGGLGNVAGDQLKASSDLGVPVVGVGLLYQQGYFRQMIDKDGAQQALFPYNDPGQLPITPLRYPNGEWLRLEIALPDYSVWLRAWQVWGVVSCGSVGNSHHRLGNPQAANSAALARGAGLDGSERARRVKMGVRNSSSTVQMWSVSPKAIAGVRSRWRRVSPGRGSRRV
jgi:starch phosphorylase